jgi:hypothetical protein
MQLTCSQAEEIPDHICKMRPHAATTWSAVAETYTRASPVEHSKM